VTRVVGRVVVGLAVVALVAAAAVHLLSQRRLATTYAVTETVPERKVNPERLARGRHGCHGPQLQGGRIPGTPPEVKPAADISPAALADWTQDDFTRALREGIRKNGTPIDPFMPWAMTKQMTDDEIAALWLYLRQVSGPQMATR
jgi:hypothetical protein